MEVGQHAPQPAPVDVGHPAACGLPRDDGLGRTLRAHEENRASVGRHAAQEVDRLFVEGQRLLEVDDMDLVALSEDVRRHPRVPETGLVTEVHSGLQHLAHRDFCHEQWARDRVRLPRASRIDPAQREGTRMGN